MPCPTPGTAWSRFSNHRTGNASVSSPARRVFLQMRSRRSAPRSKSYGRVTYHSTLSGCCDQGSDMKLRNVIAIGSVAAVAVFGVAACGGKGGGGSQGGDINVSMTSFPDYVDPQLVHAGGVGSVVERLHPTLDVQAPKGDAGTDIVPGLAKDMPQISPDGKTYKLTLRPNMKYSDGTPSRLLTSPTPSSVCSRRTPAARYSTKASSAQRISPTVKPIRSVVSPPMTTAATSPSNWTSPTERSTASWP